MTVIDVPSPFRAFPLRLPLVFDQGKLDLADSTPPAEAAILPLTVHTAASGLNLELGLPPPWLPETKAMPLIIWGAGSAVGADAVQLANRSNIHPLTCIAGESKAFVESMIDRTQGDTTLNYR